MLKCTYKKSVINLIVLLPVDILNGFLFSNRKHNIHFLLFFQDVFHLLTLQVVSLIFHMLEMETRVHAYRVSNAVLDSR